MDDDDAFSKFMDFGALILDLGVLILDFGALILEILLK